MAERFRPLLIRLPVDIDERLRYFAASRERALSWVVRKALHEYLERHEMDGSSTTDAHSPSAFMPHAMTVDELLGGEG